MVTKQNSPASPKVELVAVVPTAFEKHNPKDINGTRLQMAIAVGAKNPLIVSAVEGFRDKMGEAGKAYYNVVKALREAKLPKKEATLLLLGLGLAKSRASELNKLSTVKEEVWAKYHEGTIGFRAALQLEEGKVPPGKQEDGSGKTRKEKAKIHTLPKPLQPMLVELGTVWLAKDSTLPKAMKSGNRTEYGFTYEANGQTLYFGIFADKA